jgi:tetratricopeptide (TPR) repeat protein
MTSPDPDFVRGLLAYLRYWQGQTAVLEADQIQPFLPELPNLLHLAEMGLTLPETTRETAVLIRQCFFLFDGAGWVVAWQRILQRALDALPPDAADLRFRLLLQLGQLQRSDRVYETAVTTLHQALALAQQSGDVGYLAESHLNLGQTYQQMGQQALAQQHGEEALARQATISPRLQLLIRQLLGMIALSRGDFAQSRDHFSQITAAPHADRLLRANAYNHIGNTYYDPATYAEALDAYHKALAILEGIPFHKDKLSILLNIGGIYYGQEKLTEAEAAFRQAEQLLLPQSGFAFFKGLLHNNLGNVLTDRGQFFLAETHFQQSIAWYEQVEEDLYLSNAKSNLGRLYKRMGRPAAAIAAYQEALALARRYPEHPWARAWVQSYQEELAALQS